MTVLYCDHDYERWMTLSSGTFHPVKLHLQLQSIQVNAFSDVFCTNYTYCNKTATLRGAIENTNHKSIHVQGVCLMSFGCFCLPEQSENMMLADTSGVFGRRSLMTAGQQHLLET